ncbi:GNAT family N-acetyltransferase [Sandaracinus amylolyticus]|uniref:GNAT family N-acetyltransferase n=1 Tax=Sandaracinus amylolyticus TaxID=927083 RepID=UPI00069CDD34|nr:GNAT family N-acetyltransferase [Sandaracinus amylolyticus]
MTRFEELAWDQLSAHALYEALALRQRVFVVEQDCVYLDADGKDRIARHLFAWEGAQLVAYARLLPEGARFAERSIGRVVVAPEARGRGLARTLMERAIASIREAHGPVPIALSAQAHLERFYASLGFARTSAVYDEDGIPHVDMRNDA